MRERRLHRLFGAVRRFATQADGNIAIIFAGCLLPATLLIVGGIQFAMVESAITKLNAIADAAALSAVSKGATTTYQNTAVTGQAYAQNLFTTQAAAIPGLAITSLNVTVTPANASATAAQSLTANVTYSAKIKSLASALLGSNFTAFSGNSTATSSLPAYSDFYLLLDDSPSMGIGASQTDINLMQAANNGCAFACHSPHATDGTYPGYTLPVVPGTQLRIDALRAASAQLISTAIAQQTVPKQFRIGLYTFANSVTTLSDLTTNLALVQTLNSSIALPVTDLGTQIGDSINWLSQNKVTASGTGTQAAPFKYVLIVTDGVEDQAFNYTPGAYDNLQSPTGSWYGTVYSGVMNPAACASLKAKGVTVAVIYTTYYTLTDTRYTQMVAPFAGNIATNLQACATSAKFYAAASDAAGLNTAMQNIFASFVQQSARLTN